jgi:hypothetical protein
MKNIKKKTKDFDRKSKSFLFLLKVMRLRKITFGEFKVLTLLFILSDGSNCVKLTLENLKMVRLLNKNDQKQILSDLIEKNIAIPMTNESFDWIKENICRPCEYIFGSPKCINRWPTIFINKNHKTWALKEKPSYMEELAVFLLTENQIKIHYLEMITNAQIDKSKKHSIESLEARRDKIFEEFDRERKAATKNYSHKS